MANRYCLFTILNAESLFQIGSCRVSLRDCLFCTTRTSNANNRVSSTIEIPISLTKLQCSQYGVLETQTYFPHFFEVSELVGLLTMTVTHELQHSENIDKCKFRSFCNDFISNKCNIQSRFGYRSVHTLFSHS